MKTAEQLDSEAMYLANEICPGYKQARAKYDAIAMPTSFDWSEILGEASRTRDEMQRVILRAFTNQIQSDAIESTVQRCAKIASTGFRINDDKSYSTAKHIEEKILSLIPQKENKV